MSHIFLQDDAFLVRWTIDGQYHTTHLNFDRDLELDETDVTRGVFKLFRKCAVSLAERKGE